MNLTDRAGQNSYTLKYNIFFFIELKARRLRPLAVAEVRLER